MKLTFPAAAIYSVVVGVIVFLVEWAGWRGKFAVWDYPPPLSRIWWHPAPFIAFVFVSLVVVKAIHRLLGGDGTPKL
jgi:heme/copper-type cytochrome/quinol oxidase subunit 1